MQLASITFDGEKKNSKHYIIPASYFIKKGITPIPVNIPKQKEIQVPSVDKKESELEISIPNSKTVVVEALQVKEPPKIILKKENKRASGLSLSSIKAKKDHLIKQMDVVIIEEDLPTDPFTEKELIAIWNTYIENLRKDGKHNLASILAIDVPKVTGTTINLEFPNSTNKLEVERQQYNLLGFIRKALNNFDINLSITVNEVMEKQYAYTALEKFEKLKEKNPNIDLLRKTFDLDV
jgi:DNA polymerase-3 subunit gamma/tau